ncbi:DUF3306 domain-containing protein [Photobacterium chitinilyticum]|uniref:DUF3306 domain-containing protein n=1 Tax=Photobacterium chitinilyticum TaxID=2485123 RepID=A0A3S3T200_9GAMM|nr:DUF3306 domain-containing protein [Photobacterium chitinilyticum]RWX57336.1 DUF3306 domain-containing protein [Photobacterium chitinilyticum]
MATNFLQRWSSRKLAVREETAEVEADALSVQGDTEPVQLSDISEYTVEEVGSFSFKPSTEHEVEAESEISVEADEACEQTVLKEAVSEETRLTLKDVASVTFEGGVTSFMKSGVEKSVKKAALRKLFHSDEFNYVSDMDDHTEDFSNVPTLDSSVTKQLRNWVNQASEKLEEASEEIAQAVINEQENRNVVDAESSELSAKTESTELEPHELESKEIEASIPTLSEDLSSFESDVLSERS